jgi:DNA-directed RNA polymerase subunit M
VLFMRFCPKCGSIMVLVKREEARLLKCSRCGYEIGMTKEEEQMYTSTVKREQKVLTTKIIAKKRGLDTKRREELEQAKDSYYEIVLDQMGEYGE